MNRSPYPETHITIHPAGDQSAFESAPVAGLGYIRHALPVLLERNARLWLTFRISMVMDLLASAAQASAFFFVGSTLAGANHAGWQAHYAGFLATGMVFNIMLEASLRGPYQSLATDYWMGRLETILLSPCPVGLAVVADVGWAYARALLNVLLLVMLGWAFGARLQTTPPQLLLALVMLLLAAIAVLGFGLMSAAMFMLINAKGWNDPVAWLVGVLQGLVTGVYFPILLLPGPLYALALLLPQTYAIDAARRLLLPSAATRPLPLATFLSPVQADVLALLVFAVVLPCLGGALFTAGLAKARADGGLSRWT